MSKWSDHTGATYGCEEFHYDVTAVQPDERVIKTQDLDALELEILHLCDRCRYYEDFPRSQDAMNETLLKLQRLANAVRKNSRTP